MIQINVNEELHNLKTEGWSEEQALIRTLISAELRRGKGGDLPEPTYENRFRERMHRYKR